MTTTFVALQDKPASAAVNREQALALVSSTIAAWAGAMAPLQLTWKGDTVVPLADQETLLDVLAALEVLAAGTALLDGTLTATGTPTALPPGTCKEVIVFNDKTSTTDIWVGGAGSQNNRVPPRGWATYPVNNPNLVFVRADSGSPRVNWQAV